MKLRFRKNTLRLRCNRREVDGLAAGEALEEVVEFPGNVRMAYVLEPSSGSTPQATFQAGVIRVAAPREQFQAWAASDSVGIYFDLPANEQALKVAIEKDLECVDGPVEERDPDAFPREAPARC